MGHNQDVIKGKLVYNKPLMFYPPHLDRSDPLAYERAAREDKQSYDRRLVKDSVALFSRCEHMGCLLCCSAIHSPHSSSAFLTP